MQVNHLYGEQNRAFIVKNCLLPVCVGSDAATSAYIVLEPVPVLPETMIKAFQHFLQFLDINFVSLYATSGLEGYMILT